MLYNALCTYLQKLVCMYIDCHASYTKRQCGWTRGSRERQKPKNPRARRGFPGSATPPLQQPRGHVVVATTWPNHVATWRGPWPGWQEPRSTGRGSEKGRGKAEPMEPVQLQKRQREEGGDTQHHGPDSKRLCRGCASAQFPTSLPQGRPGQLTQTDTRAAGRPEAMQMEPGVLGSTPQVCPRCLAGESGHINHMGSS
ncbi:uncharacterized protein C10orf143 homolog isoform X1 [Petromyzon marinus]|uniref:uncharacterized protein C10orf143 homolog isoform X1 n=1 Tax=Petromyzon marinus TaxID=7757 RepID=UPI003F708B4D